ncbi:MAG: YggS family pyridoxal phosphate-dependent enzyme [Phycisphaerae bacterium]
MTLECPPNRLRENLAAVRAAIAAAAARRGCRPETVKLVAVTKYVSSAIIRELLAEGVADVGENRVQQLVARAAELAAPATTGPAVPRPAPRWHMIGHLQRNKVRALLPHCRVVHSLDSARLARELEAEASRLGVAVEAFVEVNVVGEAQKTGARPEQLPELLDALRSCARVKAVGLMTMAPLAGDPEQSRPVFRELRERLRRLRESGALPADCTELSMGMSQDYVIAVEEGATVVRVGAALYEGVADPSPA